MKTVIVSNREQASAALHKAKQTGEPVMLQNPEYSHYSLGLLYVEQMFKQAAAECPAVEASFCYDAAEDGAAVTAALQAGFRTVRFTGVEETRAKLEDIAGQYGATIVV